MAKFQVGDYVYYPAQSTKIYRLDKGTKGYPVTLTVKERNQIQTFTSEGYVYASHKFPHIFHATKENQQALEVLYGKKFEEPLDFLKHHLSLGSKVLCLVSNEPIKKVDRVWKIKNKTHVVLIDKYSDSNYFSANYPIAYKYALPISIDYMGCITYLG